MPNILANKLNVIYHRGSDHNISSGGVFNSSNTNRIFKIDSNGNWISYRPNRSINGFSSITTGVVGACYLIDANSNITWNSDQQLPAWVSDDGDEDLSPEILSDSITPWVHNHGNDKVPNFGEFSGTKIDSSQSGLASLSSTWGGSTLSTGNILRINSGHTVTWDMDSSIAFKAVIIQNGGTLTFKYDANTKIITQHFLVRETGILNTGTTINPISLGNTCRIIIDNIALDTTNDPAQFGNGLVVLGTWRGVGYNRGPSFAQLTANASSTNTTVTVLSAGLNWQVGDRLFFPDSRYAQDGTHHEIRTISSLSESSGILTITLNSGLSYDHYGQLNENSIQVTWPHVVNLTENVTIESEDATGIPGHVVCLERADIRIKNVCFKELGRTLGNISLNNTVFSGDTATSIGTNQIGKYAFHLHHVGGRTLKGNGYVFEIENCTVDGGDDVTHTRKWGFTCHGSHYGYISGCSVYNQFGGGFVFEDGSETGSIVTNCMSTYIRGLGDREINDDGATGFARNGGGWWMRSIRNRFSNIVAANCTIYGLIVNSMQSGSANGPTYQGSMGSTDTIPVPVNLSNIGHFDGFKTYCHAGMTIWHFNSPNPFVTHLSKLSPRFVFKNVVSWNTFRYACWYYESARVDFDGLQMYGDHAYTVSTGIPTEGLRMGDYAHTQHRIINSIIHGVTVGLSDQRHYVNNIVVENTDIKAAIAIECAACNADGANGVGSSSAQRPRRLIVRNCNLVPTSQTVNLGGINASFQHKQEILMNQGYSSSGDNYVVPKDVYIYNRNGNIGENYRLYGPSQTSSFKPLQTTVVTFGTTGIISSPDGNLTNDDLWKTYEPYDFSQQVLGQPVLYVLKPDAPNSNTPGLAFWGEVAPSSAYNVPGISFDGLVEDI